MKTILNFIRGVGATILLIVVIVFAVIMLCAKSYCETTVITSNEIRFSLLSDQMQSGDMPTYIIGNDLILEWYASGETAPYDSQPDPVEMPYGFSFIVPVGFVPQGSENISTYVYDGHDLSIGVWQVQVRCASTSSDGSYLWSKWSDSALFVVATPPQPPTPPYSVRIRFK